MESWHYYQFFFSKSHFQYFSCIAIRLRKSSIGKCDWTGRSLDDAVAENSNLVMNLVTEMSLERFTILVKLWKVIWNMFHTVVTHRRYFLWATRELLVVAFYKNIQEDDLLPMEWTWKSSHSLLNLFILPKTTLCHNVLPEILTQIAEISRKGKRCAARDNIVLSLPITWQTFVPTLKNLEFH